MFFVRGYRAIICLCILISTAAMLTYSTVYSTLYSTFNQPIKHYIESMETHTYAEIPESSSPFIIFDTRSGKTKTHRLNSTCSCNITGSIDALPTADAVIISTWNVGHRERNGHTAQYNLTRFLNAVELTRTPEQVYVFFSYESAHYVNAYDKQYEAIHHLHSNHLFNATMTYRIDSTYPHRYYTVQSREQGIQFQEFKFSHDLFVSKRRAAVWLNSSCGRVVRNNLSLELAKHIQIDMFGSCWEKPPAECDGPNVARRPNPKCKPYLERTYFFYMAMENSLCRDYSSEKMRDSLTHSMIPIVQKRSIPENIRVPPSAFIAFDDFNSIGEMAEYLLTVMSNETLYKSYFEWKQHFTISKMYPDNSTANLCRDLCAGKTFKPVNISQWFFNRHGSEPECIDYKVPYYRSKNAKTFNALNLLIKNRDSL